MIMLTYGAAGVLLLLVILIASRTLFRRGWYAAAFFVLLVGGGFVLFGRGAYGLTLFVLIPVFLGGLASWAFHPATRWRAAGVGALAVLAALVAFLFAGRDGLICIAMAVPLAVPLGGLGGWLVYESRDSRRAARGGVAMLLLLPPAGVTWDVRAKPPVFVVRSTIEIAAPPQTVWKYVPAFSEIPEPQEWFFRAGLAYPKLTRMEGAGIGATRYCELSTGPVVESIEIWDEPRVLQFAVTETPPPMVELSPYGRIFPKHLHGYMISKEGRFELTPLANGHTLLAGTSWYQHGLWPAEYWRWWSDAIVHRVHLRVFNHIRGLAEGDFSRRPIANRPAGFNPAPRVAR